MPARDRIRKEKLVRPDSPPAPSEVDQKGAEPMAVANDKLQLHGESFVPTTASKDAYSEEVAERYKQVPDSKPSSTAGEAEVDDELTER